MSGVLQGPGEGEILQVGPTRLVIKATREGTDGGFFLSETTLAPGMPGPPPHVHDTLHDMFYVLEGTLTVRLGDDEAKAPAGSFMCAPPGVVHTFRNASSEPVRFLNFNVPGASRTTCASSPPRRPPARRRRPDEIGRTRRATRTRRTSLVRS